MRVIRCTVTTENFTKDNFEPSFIAANHLSYLDILCISTVVRACFISSIEVKGFGFIPGIISRLGHTYFVDRRKKSSVTSEVAGIADILTGGTSVVFFPEGTSGDGSRVLPFKSSFFRSAELSGRRTVPLCINYTKINGIKPSLENRDLVFWYGDMGFFSHFIKLFSAGPMNVKLSFLEPIFPHEGIDRKDMSAEAHLRISRKFDKIV
ncbi:MAG: lysophospholipid acyltransferase family protein [Elusimicrobia bacterium]|nr:lysophospholipid acyltransferase family protein [Elusimicrobiota bacterium]